MNRKLRDLVESIASDAIKESGMPTENGVVNFEGFKGYDLEATCNHCNNDLWLVWYADNPAHRWTECGGIGEGSCSARFGYDDDEVERSHEREIEPMPPTLRSPERPGASTKVKRSV